MNISKKMKSIISYNLLESIILNEINVTGNKREYKWQWGSNRLQAMIYFFDRVSHGDISVEQAERVIEAIEAKYPSANAKKLFAQVKSELDDPDHYGNPEMGIVSAMIRGDSRDLVGKREWVLGAGCARDDAIKNLKKSDEIKDKDRNAFIQLAKEHFIDPTLRKILGLLTILWRGPEYVIRNAFTADSSLRDDKLEKEVDDIIMRYKYLNKKDKDDDENPNMLIHEAQMILDTKKVRQKLRDKKVNKNINKSHYRDNCKLLDKLRLQVEQKRQIMNTYNMCQISPNDLLKILQNYEINGNNKK